MSRVPKSERNSEVGMNKALRLYHTLKYLKPIQIRYQLWYRIKRKIGRKAKMQMHKGPAGFSWKSPIVWSQQYLGDTRFQFLNITHDFESVMDWNHASYGKLWTYNLNYFDWLHQEGLSREVGLSQIGQYVDDYGSLIDGLEPYPTSLRLINWTKFLSQHKIDDNKINNVILTDAMRLADNLEYHLLGNHLLENAFALTFAGAYLGDEKLLSMGATLLVSELEEQILNDGAHYELSPMYHRLMLYRVLDTVSLMHANLSVVPTYLSIRLRDTGQKMLSWARSMRFRNGDLPRFGDTVSDLNPDLDKLIAYASHLDIQADCLPLSESGYRKLSTDDIEIVAKVSDVMPSYQPGHTHADTFSFVLHVNHQPAIVDTGISTYENNDRRRLERSTSAHNTVTIADQDSSEVWSAFRVGQRANVTIIDDSSKRRLQAKHDGYRSLKIAHQRTFSLSDNILTITDELLDGQSGGTAYLHLHPAVQMHDHSSTMVQTDILNISVSQSAKIKVETYEYAESYNLLRQSKRLVIQFENQLITTIKAVPA